MTAQQLQDFLHRCIPATAALHIRVVSCGADGVALLMPHAPNRNHKNTVFGGSTALGATVCGWALVHLNCPEAAGNIVIQSSEIRYTAPAHGDLLLSVRSPDAAEWAHCREMLARRIGGGMGGAVCGFDSLKIQNGNPIKRISALLQSPNAKRRCKIITAAFFYAQAF